MKMIQLLYFKTVAETGRVTEAARKLDVTAPAVSIAISNLEKELGVSLFAHTCNRVVLNEAGAYFLETVNRVFEMLSNAENVLRGGAEVPCPQTKRGKTLQAYTQAIYEEEI